MQQSLPAQEFILARRSISSMAIVMALVFTVACEDNDSVAPHSGSAGAGAGGPGADQGGASGAAIAGSPSSSSAGKGDSGEVAGNGGSDEVAGSTSVAGVAGSGGAAGSAGGAAGSAGSGGVPGSAGSGGIGGGFAGSAGSSGFAGSAGSGGSGPTMNCATGGALFVVSNYADTAGNQIILRAAPKAATFALVPVGVANPAKPPQLFLVNRVCAPGGALIASDGSSNYRVDFIQSGSQLALCLSAAVSTLEAALALPPADTSHSTSTGCAGHAFTVYTSGVL